MNQDQVNLLIATVRLQSFTEGKNAVINKLLEWLDKREQTEILKNELLGQLMLSVLLAPKQVEEMK